MILAVTEPAAPPGPSDVFRSRQFVVLLVLAAVVGLAVSFAAWGFLELVHQLQVGVFDDLPRELGYDDGAPLWWYLPVLAIAGLATAAANRPAAR